MPVGEVLKAILAKIGIGLHSASQVAVAVYMMVEAGPAQVEGAELPQVELLQALSILIQVQVAGALLFFHTLFHNWSFINESFC
jgi:hypothetical protein